MRNFFIKINVLDISLGLKLPKLKAYNYICFQEKLLRNSQTFHFFRHVRVQTLRTNYDNLVEKTLIIFAHSVIISIIFKSL